MILSCRWVRKNLVRLLGAHDVLPTPQGRATFPHVHKCSHELRIAL